LANQRKGGKGKEKDWEGARSLKGVSKRRGIQPEEGVGENSQKEEDEELSSLLVSKLDPEFTEGWSKKEKHSRKGRAGWPKHFQKMGVSRTKGKERGEKGVEEIVKPRWKRIQNKSVGCVGEKSLELVSKIRPREDSRKGPGESPPVEGGTPKKIAEKEMGHMGRTKAKDILSHREGPQGKRMLQENHGGSYNSSTFMSQFKKEGKKISLRVQMEEGEKEQSNTRKPRVQKEGSVLSKFMDP